MAGAGAVDQHGGLEHEAVAGCGRGPDLFQQSARVDPVAGLAVGHALTAGPGDPEVGKAVGELADTRLAVALANACTNDQAAGWARAAPAPVDVVRVVLAIAVQGHDPVAAAASARSKPLARAAALPPAAPCRISSMSRPASFSTVASVEPSSITMTRSTRPSAPSTTCANRARLVAGRNDGGRLHADTRSMRRPGPCSAARLMLVPNPCRPAGPAAAGCGHWGCRPAAHSTAAGQVRPDIVCRLTARQTMLAIGVAVPGGASTSAAPKGVLGGPDRALGPVAMSSYSTSRTGPGSQAIRPRASVRPATTLSRQPDIAVTSPVAPVPIDQ
jgi:hypothetical protein